MSDAAVTTLFALLRHLSAGAHEPALRVWREQPALAQSVLALLRDNRMLGHFFWLIEDSPLPARLPTAAVAEMREACAAQIDGVRGNLSLLADLKREFQAAAIPFVNLKGLYISRRFFGDVNARFMWDLDVLVAPADLERAARAVGRLGLVRRSSFAPDLADYRLGIHALEMKGERGKLDIHIALRNLPGIEIDMERQWRRAHDYELGGETIPCAGDEDTLFMCCLGLATDLLRGRHNLRKCWDIFVMIREMDTAADWEHFLAQRDREGALSLVANACAFVIHLSGGGDDCPGLLQALQRRPDLLLIETPARAHAIYRRGRSPLRNRLLLSRLLPVPAWRYWVHVLRWTPARRRYYRETGRN